MTNVFDGDKQTRRQYGGEVVFIIKGRRETIHARVGCTSFTVSGCSSRFLPSAQFQGTVCSNRPGVMPGYHAR